MNDSPESKDIPGLIEKNIEKWSPAIREAKEKCLWFHVPSWEIFYTPEEIERHIKVGLKVSPFECVMIDPKEAVKRLENKIESMQYRYKELRIKAGL